MADPRFGSTSGDYEDAMRRARQANTAEYKRAADERASVEEDVAAAEQQSQRVRAGLTGTTQELSSALRTNVESITSETAAFEANTAALARNLELRRQIAATPVSRSAAGAAAALPVVATTAPAAAAPAAVQSALDAEVMAARRTIIAQLANRQGGPPSGFAAPLWGPGGDGPRLLGPGTAGGAHGTSVDPQGRYSGGALGAASQDVAAYRARVAATADSLEHFAATQGQAMQATQLAAANYASASTALTRHGALTTEFIQAFARGQVTVREFGEQMVSTMGKFGGWAVAGAAIYGVFKVFEDVRRGATDTQAAIQNLGRFIPGLGGPETLAGVGRTSQVTAAQGTLRDISTQFNEPIGEVSSAMQVMARVFHTVADAGDATRAVLAAVKLDQVPQAQAEQYLIGIGQSTGMTRGSQLEGVMNSLNQLQVSFGARVQQTLPGVARAAPMAVATGLSLPALETLVSLGVTSGQTGNQVGTALLRSMATFAWRGSSQMTLRRYGITPDMGNYGQLVEQLAGVMQHGVRDPATGAYRRRLDQQDYRQLAMALGGPQLGARTFMPLLEQMVGPRGFEARLQGAEHPRSFQADLDAALSTVSERFKAVGIRLERIGSDIASAGLLDPLIALANGFGGLLRGVEALLQPLGIVAGVFGALGGPLRTVLEVALAFAAARWVVQNTTIGGAAQSFVGRLPTLSGLRNDPREAVEGTRARLQTYLMPQYQREYETATSRAMAAQLADDNLRESYRQFEERNAHIGARGIALPQYQGTPIGAAYEEQSQRYNAEMGAAAERVVTAERDAAQAAAQYGQVQADLKVLKDRQYSWAERALYMEQRGYAIESETVGVQDQILAASRARMDAIRGGATIAEASAAAAAAMVPVARGGAAEGGAAAGAAAAVTVAAAAAARDISGDSQVIGSIRDNIAGVPQTRVIPPTPRRTFVAGPATGEGPPLFLAPDPSKPFGPSTAAEVAMMNSRNLTKQLQTPREQLMAPVQALGDSFSRLRDTVDVTRINVAAAGGAQAYLSERARGAAESLSGIMAGPGGAMAGMIGASLLGGAVGGNVGQYISGVGGAGFMGMMAGQMLGGGRLAGPLGFLAGSTLGAAQQGGGALAGAGIGTAIGAGVGALVPFLTPVLGAMIGNVAGGFIGHLLGDSSPQDQANALANRIRDEMGATYGAGDQQQTLQDLETSFGGTGSSQSSAQQKTSARIQQLQAEVLMYGTTGPGRAAQQTLNQMVADAIDQSAIDPAQAQQVIQAGGQAHIQVLTDQFKYALGQSTAPGSGLAAARTANAQLQSLQVGPVYQAALDAQATYNRAQNSIQTQGVMRGLQNVIGASPLQRFLSGASTYNQYTASQAAYRRAQQASTLAQQAQAEQGYQADVQALQARGGLHVAEQGANVEAQLREQAKNAADAFNLAWSARQLPPRERTEQMQQAEAQQIATRLQQQQQGLVELQSRGRVAIADTPIGRPDLQADANLKALQAQYKYITAHREAFDPSTIRDLAAQVADAKKAAADSTAQFATTMNDLRTQIQQAEQYGNSVAQAAIGVAGATRDLQIARQSGDPTKIAQARLNLITAQNTRHQAAMQQITSEGQLAAAQAQGNPEAVALANLNTAQQQLRKAKGPDEIRAARTALVNAQYAYGQSVLQTIQLQGQVAEAQAAGNPVAQAQIAVRTAQQEVANAHGFEQASQAARDLANAQYQLTQALEQHYITQGDLAASQEVEPLAKLTDQIAGAAKALAHAKPGSDDAKHLQTNLNNLKQQKQQTLIDQREADTQFNLEMMNISSDQAIAQLQSLLSLQGLTKAKRQSILEEIRRISLGQYSTIGGGPGSFDLMPGNIPLPTPYDVHRALRTGVGMPAANHAIHANASTQINVYVRDSADVPKVADAIDRATSGHLRSRLRAAGLRGM